MLWTGWWLLNFSFIYSVFHRSNKVDIEHDIKMATGTAKNKS